MGKEKYSTIEIQRVYDSEAKQQWTLAAEQWELLARQGHPYAKAHAEKCRDLARRVGNTIQK